MFKISQGRPISKLSMCLKSYCELSGEVGDLDKMICTPGLEVVLWQKVDPVGGIHEGYLDL